MPNVHATLTELFDGIAAAIRQKEGTSAAIKADDFPARIQTLPSGGIIQNRVLTIKSKTVTIPANNITTTAAVHAFFTEKAAEEGASNYISAALVEDYAANNHFVSTVASQFTLTMPSAWNAYRYRSGAVGSVSYPSSNYDAQLVEGTHYVMIWIDELVAPT